MTKTIRFYFTSNNGVYSTSVDNVDTDKTTQTVLRFITYELQDVETDVVIGTLKLSVSSTPINQDDSQSPSLNTYTFVFYLKDLVITTEYSFITGPTTPFPSFKNRILSISGKKYYQHGTVSLELIDRRKSVEITLCR